MEVPNNPSLSLCEPCQKRFERNAHFTKEFFKDRKFLKKTVEPDYYDTFFGAEYHHRSARMALLYFLVGLTLKQHLMTVATEDSLLGTSFERLAQDYNGHFLEEGDYQFLTVFQFDKTESITPPQRTRIKKLNAIEVCILGYQFFLFNDQRPLPPESLIRKLAAEDDFIVMQVHSSDDLLKDFEAFMEERQKI